MSAAPDNTANKAAAAQPTADPSLTLRQLNALRFQARCVVNQYALVKQAGHVVTHDLAVRIENLGKLLEELDQPHAWDRK